MAQTVKDSPAMWETWFDPWVGKIPWGGHGNPLQYSGLESPWGHKESDMTEQLSLHLTLVKDAQVNQHGRTQSLPESRQSRRGNISTKRDIF